MLRRFILLFVLWPAIGYSAYITDELLADMYSKPSNAEQRLKKLPSGTPVELISEEGEFVQIRLVNRETGWVEKRFLSEGKPAEVRLLILQGKYRQVQNKLSLAESKLIDVEALASKKVVDGLARLNAAKVEFRVGLEKALKNIIGLRDKLSAQNLLEKRNGEEPTAKRSQGLIEGKSISLARVWAIAFLALVFGVIVGVFFGMPIHKQKYLKRNGEFRRNKS